MIIRWAPAGLGLTQPWRSVTSALARFGSARPEGWLWIAVAAAQSLALPLKLAGGAPELRLP